MSMQLTVSLTDERHGETYTAQLTVHEKWDAARALEAVLRSHALIEDDERIDFYGQLEQEDALFASLKEIRATTNPGGTD
jgi:hypothetical protein